MYLSDFFFAIPPWNAADVGSIMIFVSQAIRGRIILLSQGERHDDDDDDDDADRRSRGMTSSRGGGVRAYVQVLENMKEKTFLLL